ncbi:MAG: metallopeptidase family protein [Alphaproteobacteria bacterium]|nr:metallopeptidase family protein [Alphaproteobacteria bacterium]
MGPAPNAADIEALAHVALAGLPAELRRFVHDVVVRIEDFADEETLDEMGIESEFDLLGLYRGVSLDRRSVHDVREDVDMILLYRRPLLDYWCGGEETLEAVVRHVLIHEIGHHFGLSDEAMERIEAEG